MEAASRELADWELQTAHARNEGTFFKGLFKADILQQPSDESRGAYEGEPAKEVPALLRRILHCSGMHSSTDHDMWIPTGDHKPCIRALDASARLC